MATTVSRKKAMKLLGINTNTCTSSSTSSDNDISHIGSMYCKKNLKWLSSSTKMMDLTLNENDKFTINIKNNCTYKISISVLTTTDQITPDNIVEVKLLKPNHIFSFVVKGSEYKYSPILIKHLTNSSNNDNTGNYMVYLAKPRHKKHYLTIYSTKIYTIHNKLISNKTWNMIDTLMVYVQMTYYHVLLGILILFTLFYGQSMLFLGSLSGAILSYYLKWNDYTKLILKIERLMSYIILLSCLLSFIYDDVVFNMSCNKLMNVTNMQILLFIFVLFDYSFDFALAKIDFENLIHHFFGWIGIVLFSGPSWNIGGGIITLLLFDIITTVVWNIGLTAAYKLYWIIFFVVRIIWYNYVCITSYKCIQENFVWFKYAVFVWQIFANIYHVNMIKDKWQFIRVRFGLF